MPSPLLISACIMLLTAGLYVQALIFRAIHKDPVATYKLFAVRDKLIRLVILGKVARDEPHFAAIYADLNALLRSSRAISGPAGWPVAFAQGKYLARHPDGTCQTERMRMDEIPEELRPLADELREALKHMLRNHAGVYVQLNAKRREAERIRRAHAKALLERVSMTSTRASASS